MVCVVVVVPYSISEEVGLLDDSGVEAELELDDLRLGHGMVIVVCVVVVVP